MTTIEETEEIRKNFEGAKLLIENLNRENAVLQEKNQKLIDKACKIFCLAHCKCVHGSENCSCAAFRTFKKAMEG